MGFIIPIAIHDIIFINEDRFGLVEMLVVFPVCFVFPSLHSLSVIDIFLELFTVLGDSHLLLIDWQLVDDALDFLLFLVVLGQLGDKRVDVFSGLVVFQVLQLPKVAVIEDRVDLLVRFVIAVVRKQTSPRVLVEEAAVLRGSGLDVRHLLQHLLFIGTQHLFQLVVLFVHRAGRPPVLGQLRPAKDIFSELSQNGALLHLFSVCPENVLLSGLAFRVRGLLFAGAASD